MKKVLFVASECVPFVKTGGLADVIGALPKYIDNKKYDVKVILPKYTFIDERYKKNMKKLQYFCIDMGWNINRNVEIYELEYEKIKFYFIDNEEYFSSIVPYGDMKADIEKFAFFCKATLTALPIINFKPDIIHCNDWQTGLIPVYLKSYFLKEDFFKNIKTIMTIHNLKFQGVWDIGTVKGLTGFPDYFFEPDKLEAYGNANYLKGGIVFADYVTTVSKTYSKEILEPFFGEGLDGLMRVKANVLGGIVNGVDYNKYNPETDEKIYKNYDKTTFRKKKILNKVALQKELGLEVDKNKFMLGIVSRLTSQKGLDLVECVMEEICHMDLQFVIIGTGEEKYENLFRHFASKYKNKVSANIFFSEEKSHKIYAACDALLMPSLFEPCGLSQLISYRYGVVPIVRETGGLKDTVAPYNEYEGTGTGFSFRNYNAHEMLNIIRYANNIFYNRKRDWNKIIDRGMELDFSWNSSAREYEKIYEKVGNNF